MRIKKLRLFNGYKRFHDLTIDLGENPARIIALVGPNGCGKSSVLDGILFHHNAFGALGNKGSKNYLYHSMHNDPAFDYQSISIEFTSGTYYNARQSRKGKENTLFSFRSPYRYNSNLNVTESRAVGEIYLNNYGASSSSDLDDKMEENYRRLNIKFIKYMNAEDCKPSEAKEKIIGDLNKSIKNCLNLEIDNLGNIESSQGTIYFKKPDHPKPFSFNVLSSGEKEVIDILLDLYLRQDEYCDTVYLLDEPELHINTSIQKKLLIEINRLIGEQCQIWLTTHSIGFMRALQDELNEKCQIIYFDENHNLAAETNVLTPTTKSSVMWRKIFGIALDDLTHLLSPRRIVYCEGRDSPGTAGRERGLDAQVYNAIFNDKYPDTLFVSSGGNTELDKRSDIAIAILSKALPNLEVLVLKDRDSGSGRCISSKDRELYLETNPKNHRMLIRWEIENYLFSKDVLVSFCKKNELPFDEAQYDKIITDIENQSVKELNNHIRNICGIKTNINPEVFKLKLSESFPTDSVTYKELERLIFSHKTT
ncbi:AAA family ATPase [Klebsiella oxytoca]|uniref:AAA family ATPase n=1 Tax=Klebsiella TaxID=570 RepID=UPI0013D4770D|nr:ATP-binding protein [Klebsiella oxytoca]MBG2565345.1 AAA family ATPase [Klebsiella oxytoca]MBG2608918.1 AAA family ATPase [Klebsiella oxytoca]MBZ7167207.1 AAA family ATPase [Klebsiella oxytoca]MBZ7641186.1 AAA family ATPase [Klebsiella oxytoca]MDU3023684.1 AAA family ATPase [Klebsiella oxytoca]